MLNTDPFNPSSSYFRYTCVPGGDAAEDGVEVTAAQREQDPTGRVPQLGCVLVALAIRVDKMTDLGQQRLHKHGLV